MLTKKNNEMYPLRTEKTWQYRRINVRGWFKLTVLYLFISLAPPTVIQSDDALIRRRIVVNECGAYSRAVLFNIFVLICGA